MTPKRKRTFLLGLFAAFIIIIPVLILYSSGYRVSSKLKLVKTGGIYLANDELDAYVKINGKEKKRADFLERSMLVRNLRPATYNVRVEKNGYRVWEKNVTVQEHMVEVCYPLLIPEKLNPEMIPKTIKIESDKKGVKPKFENNDEFFEAIELFKLQDKPAKGFIPGWDSGDVKKLKLGADRKLRSKVFLSREGNKIFVKWIGSKEKRPFFIDSEKKKVAYAPDQKILSFGFFPGRDDSMLVLLADKTLYAVEIDTRFDMQNVYKIAQNCSRFADSDELLYYSAGGNLFKIDFNP